MFREVTGPAERVLETISAKRGSSGGQLKKHDWETGLDVSVLGQFRGSC